MPKVTEAHRQARREQILEAALNCFTKNGFHQTTMKDICKEAGLSAGAVYLHFTSKEDIIEESRMRVRRERATRVEALKQEGLTTNSLNRFWDYYEKRLAEIDTDKGWRLSVQLMAEALRNPRISESIRANWNEAEKQTAELIRKGAELGWINPHLDPEIIGGMFVALHDGLIAMKIIDPERNVFKYLDAFRTLLSSNGKTASYREKKRRLDDDGKQAKEVDKDCLCPETERNIT